MLSPASARRPPPHLRVLDLSTNPLNQTLSDQRRWLEAASELQELYLDYTLLHGTVPGDLALPPGMTSLDLRHSQLSGSLPPNWSLPPALASLSLEKNGFVGTLPSSVALPAGLQVLDL